MKRVYSFNLKDKILFKCCILCFFLFSLPEMKYKFWFTLYKHIKLIIIIECIIRIPFRQYHQTCIAIEKHLHNIRLRHHVKTGHITSLEYKFIILNLKIKKTFLRICEITNFLNNLAAHNINAHSYSKHHIFNYLTLHDPTESSSNKDEL